MKPQPYAPLLTARIEAKAARCQALAADPRRLCDVHRRLREQRRDAAARAAARGRG